MRNDSSDGAALLAFLRDPSPYVAKIAADALCENADPAITEHLVAEYDYFDADVSRDPGCYIRTAFANHFGKKSFNRAAGALRRGACAIQIEPIAGVRHDVAAQLRAASALGLAEIRDPLALTLIAPLLFDNGMNGIMRDERVQPGTRPDAALNDGVRAMAARAVGRLGDAAGFPLVALILEFPDLENAEEVVVECMAAALTLNPERATPLISAYIRTGRRDLQAAAAMALITARIPHIEALVDVAIASSRENYLKALLFTVAASRSPVMLDIFYAQAAAARDEQRLYFCEAAAAMTDRDALPLLRGLAQSDRSARVRAAAANAVKQTQPGAE